MSVIGIQIFENVFLTVHFIAIWTGNHTSITKCGNSRFKKRGIELVTVQLCGNLCKKACCKLACINAFLYKLTYDGHQSFLFSCFLKTRRCMAELLRSVSFLQNFLSFRIFTVTHDFLTHIAFTHRAKNISFNLYAPFGHKCP